jgi:hypothetical protein
MEKKRISEPTECTVESPRSQNQKLRRKVRQVKEGLAENHGANAGLVMNQQIDRLKKILATEDQGKNSQVNKIELRQGKNKHDQEKDRPKDRNGLQR